MTATVGETESLAETDAPTGNRIAVPTLARRLESGIAVLLAVTCAGLAILAACWALTGGRWLVVQTPSMAEAAPVGTLLWMRPVHELHAGQIVSFHPPNEKAATYTHRIVAVAADGTVTTKGDGNAAVDPWVLHRSDITGVAAMRWYAIGWLIRAAPLLVLGTIALSALLRWATAPRWKLPAAIVGVATMLTACIVVYRPLIAAQLVVFDHVDPSASGSPVAHATYVSTGLLPVRVTSADQSVVLHDGQFGTVLTRHVDAAGRFSAHVGPALTWWMWALLIGACFVPALWSALTAERAPRPTGDSAAD